MLVDTCHMPGIPGLVQCGVKSPFQTSPLAGCGLFPSNFTYWSLISLISKWGGHLTQGS